MNGKTKKIILAVVGVFSLGWVFWVTVGGNAGISKQELSYHVVDSTMTTVDFAVSKEPEATAQCAVKAMDDTYAVVGWKVVTIPPNGTDEGASNGRTTTIRTQLRTDALAVTGVVENCWVVK